MSNKNSIDIELNFSGGQRTKKEIDTAMNALKALRDATVKSLKSLYSLNQPLLIKVYQILNLKFSIYSVSIFNNFVFEKSTIDL